MFKIRNSEKYEFYWNLNCSNFKSKTIKENTCRICTLIKPERTSHCKTCRKCVKKLDHHCSIVNNCVGLRSYKIFINMLVYSIFTIMIVIITLMENLKFYLIEFYISLFTIIYIMIIIIMLTIECLLIYFFIFHLLLIFQGITQYEYTFKFHIYDQDYYSEILKKSLWEKFIEVFGENSFFWFFPISKIF